MSIVQQERTQVLEEWLHKRVKLTSRHFEVVRCHRIGDIGRVIDVRSNYLKSGRKVVDIRVEWDNGAVACWVGAEDFTVIQLGEELSK